MPRWISCSRPPDSPRPVEVKWDESGDTVKARYIAGDWECLERRMGFQQVDVDPTHWRSMDTTSTRRQP